MTTLFDLHMFDIVSKNKNLCQLDIATVHNTRISKFVKEIVYYII